MAQDWDEPKLLARLRAGEQEAFQHRVQSLGGRLKRVARGLVGAAAADDGVQDTWDEAAALMRAAAQWPGQVPHSVMRR